VTRVPHEVSTTMSGNLSEVESCLSTLWTQRRQRQAFLQGQALEEMDPAILSEVDPRGVRVYATLLRNSQQSLMDSIYPGCAKLLGKHWYAMVSDYFETCPPTHFNLNAAASEFSKFLKERTEPCVNRYPFLYELADYEWIELEILEHAGEPIKGEQINLDEPAAFQVFAPIVNPVMIVRHYLYPIAKVVDWLRAGVKLPRRIGKQATHMIVYRDPDELDARFLELGELAVSIVEKASQETVSYADLIGFAVARSGGDAQATVVEVLSLFERLHELKLFMGSQKA
jgi:hypothetical protein